jgi:hypothetical protein
MVQSPEPYLIALPTITATANPTTIQTPRTIRKVVIVISFDNCEDIIYGLPFNVNTT